MSVSNKLPESDLTGCRPVRVYHPLSDSFRILGDFSYLSNVVQHDNVEAAEPTEANEAEVGYFEPIPSAE